MTKKAISPHVVIESDDVKVGDTPDVVGLRRLAGDGRSQRSLRVSPADHALGRRARRGVRA
jgi:hypothetical protein